MSYITPELQNRLTERAKPHYSDILPYHNWDHAVDVMQSAGSIALRSTSLELKEKAPLLIVAAAWHDADYHLPNDGFTKEERSARLVLDSLPELTLEDRELIASGIIDTTVAKTTKDTAFGEALHTADLGYFAADYQHFMQRLSLMREEWGSPSWEETITRTVSFGGHVIQEVGKFLPTILSADDANNWLTTIRHNLAQLEEEQPL